LVDAASESVSTQRQRPQPDGPVGEGGRNDHLIRYAGKLRGANPALGEYELFALLWQKNVDDCTPPLTEPEVQKIARSAMRFGGNPEEPIIFLDPGDLFAEPDSPKGDELAIQLGALMRLDLTPPPPLVPGLIDSGTSILLAGPPNVGKSWIALQLALSVATGTRFLDHFPTEPATVLVIDEEGTLFGAKDRMTMLVNGHGVGFVNQTELYFAIGKGIKLTTPAGLLLTQRMIDRYHPKLVIIDSMIRVGADENKAREMADMFAGLQLLKTGSGAAFCLVHHTRKPGEQMPEDLGDLIRGSTEIRAYFDTIFLGLPGETSTDIVLHTIKQRWHPKPSDPYAIRLLTRADEPWAMLGYQGVAPKQDNSTRTTQSRIIQAIIAIIAEDTEPDLELIAARISRSTGTTRDHLRRMLALNLVAERQHKFRPQVTVYVPGTAYHPNGQHETVFDFDS